MTSFSGWGPTDDGRIKPDVVTNGITLYSPTASSDTSYASYSGTSVASPGAAGAATLLVDYYGRLFPNDAMRAGTLKALMIHTADDLGQAGPDYKFGWGLLNTQAAAEQIRDHYRFPGASLIVEDVLDAVSPVRTYSFEWDGHSDIWATLCWTDPPGPSTSALDNPTPRLVNDLDLRVEGPGGSVTYYPYVLNPAAPDQPATTGDNIRDNVEQVVIPCADAPTQYTVWVSYKGTLTNGQQHFSLVMNGQFTGQPWADLNDDGSVDFADLGIFCDYWLDSEPSVDVAPTCGDGIVDFLDFAIFAESWQ
jgi:hypothetical protein